MKIYIVNKNDTSDNIYIGGSKDFPIPRVGEFIEAGLATYPKVQDVVYDYEMNIVYIVVQATLKHMKLV
jgi:hypothetical protein